MFHHRPIPYDNIEQLGLIGDRRTAALVAADGTLNWLCWPDYDGDVLFGSLLDHKKGGFWTLGPARRRLGIQKYADDTAVLVTSWEDDQGRLELTDLMAWPEQDRPRERQSQHVVLRRLRCTAGRRACCLQVHPSWNFQPVEAGAAPGGTVSFSTGAGPLSLWTNHVISVHQDEASAAFDLEAGQEVWAILSAGGPEGSWTAERAQRVLEDTQRYWMDWIGRLTYSGPRMTQVRRAALCIHLLSYAPCGSVVAAPTASLPERIGGDWNADYRYAWLRDASLSLMTLAQLGAKRDTRRYLEWLSGLVSSFGAPLQTLYGVRGETTVKQQENEDLFGYRGSKPVRFGNHAYKQTQHSSLGYLLDCIKIYVDEGGDWEPAFWKLVSRAADHLAEVWKEPGNSIWELSEKRHFVSDKVMCWVGLDRALKLAEKLGERGNTAEWENACHAVRTEVLTKGWSEKLQAFRQHYDADNLDSASLLIPIMGFLPAEDRRVRSTMEAIADRLAIDEFVYRFDPEESPGVPQPPLPLGEFEGAFLPCTCWMATAYALTGQRDRAEAILKRIDGIAAVQGLLAEGVDPRAGTFLGNHPLLFSQAEYVRAVRTLERME